MYMYIKKKKALSCYEFKYFIDSLNIFTVYLWMSDWALDIFEFKMLPCLDFVLVHEIKPLG